MKEQYGRSLHADIHGALARDPFRGYLPRNSCASATADIFLEALLSHLSTTALHRTDFRAGGLDFHFSAVVQPPT